MKSSEILPNLKGSQISILNGQVTSPEAARLLQARASKKDVTGKPTERPLYGYSSTEK